MQDQTNPRARPRIRGIHFLSSRFTAIPGLVAERVFRPRPLTHVRQRRRSLARNLGMAQAVGVLDRDRDREWDRDRQPEVARVRYGSIQISRSNRKPVSRTCRCISWLITVQTIVHRYLLCIALSIRVEDSTCPIRREILK